MCKVKETVSSNIEQMIRKSVQRVEKKETQTEDIFVLYKENILMKNINNFNNKINI